MCRDGLPPMSLQQCCGYDCRCSAAWYERGWSCPTKPPVGPAACGYPCQCQHVWMSSGWICPGKIKHEFCLASNSNADISGFNVQVVNLGGETMLYIRGEEPFTADEIRVALEKQLPNCYITLYVGDKLLTENALYDAQVMRDEFGTTVIQAIKCERGVLTFEALDDNELDDMDQGCKYFWCFRCQRRWCPRCQRHAIYKLDNLMPRCPRCCSYFLIAENLM